MPEHSSLLTWATSVAVGYAYHAGPYGHVLSEQSAARQPSSQPHANVSSSQTPWPLHGMSPGQPVIDARFTATPQSPRDPRMP